MITWFKSRYAPLKPFLPDLFVGVCFIVFLWWLAGALLNK